MSKAINKQHSPTRELYNFLQQAFDFYNERLFEGRIPDALIVLSRRHNVLGHFSPKRYVPGHFEGRTDEIAMNPEYMGDFSIDQTLSTLVHEMCHSDLYNNVTNQLNKYHCKKFSKIMHDVGLQTSSTGLPGGKPCGYAMSHYIIDGGRFQSLTAEFLSSEVIKIWFDNKAQSSEVQFIKRGLEDRLSLGSQANSDPSTQEPVDLSDVGSRNEPNSPVQPGFDTARIERYLKMHAGAFVGVLDSKLLLITKIENNTGSENLGLDDSGSYCARQYEMGRPLSSLLEDEFFVLSETQASSIILAGRDMLSKDEKPVSRIRYSCLCDGTPLGRPGLSLQCMQCNSMLNPCVEDRHSYEAYCFNLGRRKNS